MPVEDYILNGPISMRSGSLGCGIMQSAVINGSSVRLTYGIHIYTLFIGIAQKDLLNFPNFETFGNLRTLLTGKHRHQLNDTMTHAYKENQKHRNYYGVVFSSAMIRREEIT